MTHWKVSMSVSSVAASSLASPPPPAPIRTSDSKGAERKPATESTVRQAQPREPEEEQQPVKAALPLKVGQVIDISA